MAEKRERLKLEAEKLKELGLDNIIDIVAKKPVDRIPPPSAPESPPKIQSIYASDDAGYQKGRYRFRNAKRPSNYHPDALQEWNAKLEAEKEEHERQKLVEFKEEKKMTVLLRRRNNKAKKMKLLKVFKNDCATSQSSNKDADNDDVKIVKVVTKPNQKPASTSSKIGKHLDESLSIEKSKKNFRILNPPSRPEHLPVVCFPPSSIRRAPLHTLPNIKKTSSMASQSGKPFVDDCFIFVPCSTPSSSTSSSYNVTVPPPPTIKSTTSKRVL
uniref:Uncharacterized protein n=1 Tax=Panagrolaimus sp. ES5 TaxID=591445 RepID=A0AC34GGJ6_9BILA